jgi:hypothetical protein
MASTPEPTNPPIHEVPPPVQPEPGLPDLTDVPPPDTTDGWPDESDAPHLDHGDV